MNNEFFYLQGYQPKGGKRILMSILWIFVLLILITIIIGIYTNVGKIASHYYLYIIIIVAWLIATPLIKPKGVLLLPKERKLRLISIIGNFKLSGAEFKSIVSIEPIEKTEHRLVITLVDGTKKYLSVQDREDFIERFNSLR